MKLVTAVVFLDVLIWAMADADVDEVAGWFQSVMNSESSYAFSELENNVGHRSKRSLFNFQDVIHCVQPWSKVLSTYGDYGCYCGFKGHGKPLDDTDNCCYDHDNCYNEANKLASSFTEMTLGSYFADYKYNCTEYKVSCDAKDNTEYGQALCICDKKAAECFAANRRTYSPQLFNIDTKKFCGENTNYQGLIINSHFLTKLYSCVLGYNEDRCCVDQGYNSVLQLCCEDKVWNIPGSNPSVVGCCGNKLYDTRVRMCCHGVLYPSAQHLQCCSGLGEVVDTRFGRCVNETIVLHDDLSRPQPSSTSDDSETLL